MFSKLIMLAISFAASHTLASPKQEIFFTEAQKIAEKTYKKHRKSDPKFSCRLIEETENLWAFGCESLTIVPGPGAAVFINVKKPNGNVVVYPGK